MLRRRIAFFALLALALFLLLYTGSGIYLWIVLFQMFILLVGAANVALTFACVSIVQNFAPRRVTRGGKSLIDIEVHNEFFLPLGHILMFCGTVLSASDGEARRYYVSPAPHSCEKATVEIDCPTRGEYEVGVLAMKVTDLFGIVSLRLPARLLRISGDRTVTVMPAVSHGADELWFDPRRMNELSDEHSGAVKLVGEHDGQKARWIMPASQKVVPASQNQRRDERVVLVDCAAHSLEGEDAENLENNMTDIAASFAWRFCHAKRRTRLFAVSDIVDEWYGADDEAARKMQEGLARVIFAGETDLSAVIRRCCSAGVPDEMVIVCGEPTAEVHENISALAARGCCVTLAICLARNSYDSRLVRMLGDLKMLGVSAVVVMPGDDVLSALEGVL